MGRPVAETDESTQLARILAVRVTKRAAIRLRLVTLAAEARDTELAAQAAAVRAEQITVDGLTRIQTGRTDILSGPFLVNAMSELRQTVTTVTEQCAAAQVVVEETATLAAQIEQERQAVARNLLTADTRCERLEDKLKELKHQSLNKRDERDIEDFASTQIAMTYATPAPVVHPPTGGSASGAKTEASEPVLCRTTPRSPMARPD
jgi:hypothetical protein